MAVECNGDLSFLTAIPSAITNAFFGTIFGGNTAPPANAQGQKSFAEQPIAVQQKVADKQGDGNYNQNLNLNNNKGAVNLSSYGKKTESNYGGYEQARRNWNTNFFLKNF